MKNKSYFLIIFLILGVLALVNPSEGNAQQSLTFEKNIKLPDSFSGSSAIMDIVYANGKVFVYSASGILVFSEDSLNFITKISFQPNKQYGKFNPQYYDQRLWLDDINVMAVKGSGNQSKIFVVTPDLDIIRIDATTPYLSSTVVNRPDSLSSFRPMSGPNILKYDNVNDRLYWLITGKNLQENCIGNFHYRDRYFAIFDGDANNNLTLYYDEFRPFSDDPDEYRDNGISDIEFNHSNNYYYLTKLNKIEIWEIVSDPDKKTDKIRTINISGIYGAGGYYKFGKMLYVKNDSIGIHKIIALPYRYPRQQLGDGKVPKIFVIEGDGNAESISIQQLDSPSKRILDGMFLNATQDLIVSYAPDTGEIIQAGISDISIFHYNSTSNIFDTIPISFSTDYADSTGPYDINSPFRLVTNSDSKVLINKKDEIVELHSNNGTYSHSQIFSGENNFFLRGAEGPSAMFIVNSAKSGLEMFSKTPAHLKSTRTSFPAYHIVSNTSGEKLYFFNRLTTSNTGILVYKTSDESIINLNEDDDATNDIVSPVGDCLFNPYRNQFLISENANNGSNPATIKLLNASDNSLDSTIQLIDKGGNKAQYAKEMFIAADGNLYIATNMLVGLIEGPKIFVFDATTYSLKRTVAVTTPNPNFASAYYVSNFCDNVEDTSVYMSIFGQEFTFEPYTAEYNSMMGFTDTAGVQTGGKLVRLSSDLDSVISVGFGVKPGKILAAYKGGSNGNNESQFTGKVFIVSKTLYTYDIHQGNFIAENQKLNDIIYNPVADEIYGFADEEGLDCASDRKAVIYKINYDSLGQLEFTEIGFYNGQVSSLTFNPYDQMLYVHTKFDNQKLGEYPSKVIIYDPSGINGYYKGSVNLNNPNYPQNRSSQPDIDHNFDTFYFLYNLTTPYINYYTNKVYLPNGGHSNVSVVGFEVRESLVLRPGENGNPGITWLSIPRHIRSTTPELTPTDTVFAQENVSGGYNQLTLNYLNPYSGVTENATWSIQFDWQYFPSDSMQNINSIRGYKLELKPNDEKLLYLRGTLEGPGQSIAIKSDVENWTGYWLYEEQDIFDALGDVVDSLYLIKHQDWTCIKGIAPWLDPQQVPPPWEAWFCDNRLRIIKYGEMVVLKGGRSDFSFQWNTGGQNPGDENGTQNPVYYSYNEQPDYTPMIIELDSADNPSEIGAFIGDTCIGAQVVEAGDSVVTMRTYLQGNPGDSVVFEQYYGNKSTARQRVNSYFVWNKEKQLNEKRVVRVGERKDHYFITFKKQQEKKEEPDKLHFNIWPNPASTSLFYSLALESKASVNISVFNITGKRVAVSEHKDAHSGVLKGVIQLKDFSGSKLKPGVYLVKLAAGDLLETKKIIVK